MNCFLILSVLLACLSLLFSSFIDPVPPRSIRNIQIHKVLKSSIIPITTAASVMLSLSSTAYCSTNEFTKDYLQYDYDPSNERIYDTFRRSYIPADPSKYLENNLRQTNVITIGEVHSNICHHKLQFDIVRAVSSIRSPSATAIGLECFYRQHQKYLDRFIYVHQDMAQLKYETDWDSTWGYDLNH